MEKKKRTITDKKRILYRSALTLPALYLQNLLIQPVPIKMFTLFKAKTYSFCQLGIHHEIMNVLLRFGKF